MSCKNYLVKIKINCNIMRIQKIKKIVLKVINMLGYHLSAIDHFPNEKAYARPSKYEDLKYYETPIGKYYLPKIHKNDSIAKCMKNGIFFDEIIIDAAKRYIKEDTVVIDIGANFGQMSIEFSKYVGKNGMVYSFEAQKYVYEILVKNIEANCPSRVGTYYKAVYDIDNKMFRFPPPDLSKTQTLGSFGLNPQIDKGIEVSSVTIDSLKIEQPISFIKCDIQGSDLFALRGARETIMKHKMPIIFEFEQEFQDQFKTSFQDYVDFVQSINYKFVENINFSNFLIIPKN